MEPEEMLSANLKLDIGVEHFELKLAIPANPVKPQRMLPVFQKVANEIVVRGIEKSAAAGKPVSCRAGCTACCRQPLIISEAEAYNLAELVESMPAERRRAVKRRFHKGRERFEKLGWFERLDEFSDEARNGRCEDPDGNFAALLSEYMKQSVECPFLENNLCSIYEERPLMCREYMVTSPAENCEDPRPQSTVRLPISGEVSQAFAAMVKTPRSEKPASLLIIRLLEFVGKHGDEFDERPGPAWAAEFFQRLTNGGLADPPKSTAVPDG